MPSSTCLRTMSATAPRSRAGYAFSSKPLPCSFACTTSSRSARPRQAAHVRGENAIGAAFHRQSPDPHRRRGPRSAVYCGLMPAVAMTASSAPLRRARMSAAACGVVPSGSLPLSRKRLITSGCLRPSLKSAFRRSAIRCGVFGGRKAPTQVDGREIRQRLGDRRHIGQFRQPLLGRHRQHFQPAVLHVRHRRGEIVEHDVDVAGDQSGQRQRRAAVRHVSGTWFRSASETTRWSDGRSYRCPAWRR